MQPSPGPARLPFLSSAVLPSCPLPDPAFLLHVRSSTHKRSLAVHSSTCVLSCSAPRGEQSRCCSRALAAPEPLLLQSPCCSRALAAPEPLLLQSPCCRGQQSLAARPAALTAALAALLLSCSYPLLLSPAPILGSSWLCSSLPLCFPPGDPTLSHPFCFLGQVGQVASHPFCFLGQEATHCLIQ